MGREVLVLNLDVNGFHFGFVSLDLDDFFNRGPDVLELQILGEILLLLVQDGVVEDVMDKVVDELCRT